MRTLPIIGIALALAGAPVTAQQLRTAVTPDTIRVGDVAGVTLQVDLPAGAELIVPDTLDLSGDLENAARRRIRVDSLNNGELRHQITWPITAWRPGRFALPDVILRIRRAGDEQALNARLPAIRAVSVLPADTTGIEARPPRDVWGANRLWWPIALLALLAVVVIALLVWWWRRRRRRVEEVVPVEVPPVPAREWALRELARIRAAGWIERGEHRRFYIELSDALRGYASMLDAAWSTDLTTRELGARMRAGGVEPGVLQEVLERADLVKFARHQPGRERPRDDLELAQRLVETFERPVPFAEAA